MASSRPPLGCCVCDHNPMIYLVFLIRLPSNLERSSNLKALSSFLSCAFIWQPDRLYAILITFKFRIQSKMLSQSDRSGFNLTSSNLFNLFVSLFRRNPLTGSVQSLDSRPSEFSMFQNICVESTL